MRDKVNVFSNWLRRRSTLALFFPGKQAAIDPVSIFYSELYGSLKKKAAVIVADCFPKSLNHLKKRKKIGGNHSRVALFAHPTSCESAFEIFCKVNQRACAATAKWFSQDSKAFDFLVAHVCKGAVILTDQQWSEVFPDWISYSDELKFLNGSSKAGERWRNVGNEIVGIAMTGKRVQASKNRLQATYHNALAEAFDSMDPSDGDAITIVHLNMALESIKTSEE